MSASRQASRRSKSVSRITAQLVNRSRRDIADIEAALAASHQNLVHSYKRLGATSPPRRTAK